MIRYIITISVFFFTVFCINGQSIERQIIGSSGAVFSNTNATVEYTVGETFTTIITDGTTSLSQGFHQGVIKLLVIVNPKIFLQGASLNPVMGQENLMRDNLNNVSILPNNSPYEDGVSIDRGIFSIFDQDSVVDWVWVELRDANDSEQVIAGQSALLQRDGDILNAEYETLEFQVPNGDYYIVVNHRNHLAIRSKNAISLNKSNVTIDFSSSTSNIQGEANAVTLLPNGKYAMIAGDIDNNGQVQNVDINTANQSLGSSGYNNADADMNGQVQNSDIQSIILQNSGKGTQF